MKIIIDTIQNHFMEVQPEHKAYEQSTNGLLVLEKVSVSYIVLKDGKRSRGSMDLPVSVDNVGIHEIKDAIYDSLGWRNPETRTATTEDVRRSLNNTIIRFWEWLYSGWEGSK